MSSGTMPEEGECPAALYAVARGIVPSDDDEPRNEEERRALQPPIRDRRPNDRDDPDQQPLQHPRGPAAGTVEGDQKQKAHKSDDEESVTPRCHLCQSSGDLYTCTRCELKYHSGCLATTMPLLCTKCTQKQDDSFSSSSSSSSSESDDERDQDENEEEEPTSEAEGELEKKGDEEEEPASDAEEEMEKEEDEYKCPGLSAPPADGFSIGTGKRPNDYKGPCRRIIRSRNPHKYNTREMKKKRGPK